MLGWVSGTFKLVIEKKCIYLFCVAYWHHEPDFGIDSKEGQESWKHLNRIHGFWRKRTRNQDFVYVLCCFIVDTIRFIEVFGWRKLTAIEREGSPPIYH